MASSVLFDAPGPATRRRHRLYTILAVVALLAALAWIFWRFAETGQFRYELWEPFITPRYVEAMLSAWWQTITMAVLSIAGALVFGFVFGVAKLSEHAWIRRPAWLIVEFFRAIPVIMLMILLFYTAFNSLSIERGGYWTVVFSLTLYNGSVIAEVVRAGILAVPKGQAEAAHAVGLRKSQVMRIILLPQAVKIMIPAIISQMVVALKDTSLILIVVGVGLTKFYKQLPLTFGNQVQTIIVVAALYIVTNLLLTWIANRVQRRYVGERPVLSVAMVGEGEAKAKPVG